MRSQRQLAAGDEIELARLAKDLQHDGAERIAGERIGGGAQRRFDIGGAHGDEQARIEAELGKAVRRQRAGFKFGKILPHPDQRFARRNPPGNPRKETGRGRALVPLGKHFMHGGAREPAAQHRIGTPVAERDLVQRVDIASVSMRSMLPRRDASVLMRAPFMRRRSSKVSQFGFGENQKLAHLFMICSNIKLTGPAESIELAQQAIH